MATLDNSNIVNGNVIQPNDLLQLYDAFDYAGASTKYNVTLSGSLTGNASTATTATSASNTTTALSTTGVFYPAFVSAEGTKPVKIDADLEYNADTNSLTVTSSHAVSSSYAANASVSQVQGSYDDGTIQTGNFKFVAGRATMSTGNATSSAFPLLAGKTLGVNAWITANYISGYGPGDIVAITSISSSGAILFDDQGGGSNGQFVFTGFYI